MKIFKILALSSIVLIGNGCYAQTGEGDKEISMLKEFYTAYSKIGFNVEDLPTVDSLQEKYCTSQLRREAREYLEDGHDLLTDDWGISKESLASMTIVKDTKETTYAVSYIVDTYPISPHKPVKKQVSFHVTVVKEGESYKIASVK